MRELSIHQLLHAWECGLTQSSTQRALSLLTIGWPDASIDTLAELSIGQRDTRLLTLRETLFGSDLVSVVSCPHCGEKIELNFSINDIRLPLPTNLPSELSLDLEGYHVRFRLPNSRDLASINCQDSAIAQAQLVQCCLIETTYQQIPQETNHLPQKIIEATIGQMAEADPQAQIEIAVNCPNCQHAWKSIFDIVSYFWDELNVWAIRLLREVHLLASSYGWAEADILAMHPYRRQLYLEMVNR